MGKTTLIEKLQRWLNVYFIPNEDFYDAYEDNLYDLCVIDEFKANKTIQWLNGFLQGGSFPLRKKGSQYLKRQNLPTIILSNYSLRECYKKVPDDKLETLECRVKTIYVSQFINVDWEEFITPRVEE